MRSAHLENQLIHLQVQIQHEVPVQKQYFSSKKSLKIDIALMKNAEQIPSYIPIHLATTEQGSRLIFTKFSQREVVMHESLL